jgi:hypothetical protein
MTHNELGAAGEVFVSQVLAEIGLEVEFGDGQGPDLYIAGTPLEVKAARPRPYKSGRKGYQFCLHRSGRAGVQAPVVVLLCYWHKDRDPVAFVIPSEELGDRRKVTIPGYPWTYSGRWARWYRRWETLANFVGEVA